MKARLICDTETGGLDPNTSSLLTFACCVWRNGAIEDQLLLKINEPEIFAEEQALKVNGLDIQDLKDNGLSPTQAVLTLENFVAKNNLMGVQEFVAHNRSFDYGFMQRLYKLADRDFRGKFSHRGICTMQTAIFLDLCGIISPRGYTLDTLCKYFGITIVGRESGTHGALGDAIACGQLLTKLVEVTTKQKIIPPPEKVEAKESPLDQSTV